MAQFDVDDVICSNLFCILYFMLLVIPFIFMLYNQDN